MTHSDIPYEADPVDLTIQVARGHADGERTFTTTVNYTHWLAAMNQVIYTVERQDSRGLVGSDREADFILGRSTPGATWTAREARAVGHLLRTYVGICEDAAVSASCQKLDIVGLAVALSSLQDGGTVQLS